MAYRLNPHLFIEHGPTLQAEQSSRTSSARAFQAWMGLTEEQRLAAVEQALTSTNDNLNDGFPVAL
jgi:hypothetical protein